VLPSVLLCVVGASTAAVYTVSVFRPLIMLWYQLALPVSE
jgi:hypothetical protein